MKAVRRKDGKERLSLITGIMLVVLCLYVIFLLMMIFWAFITSFKGRFDFAYNFKFKFPDPWTFEPYIDVINNGAVPVGNMGDYVGIPQMFLYGILYALGCALVNTIVPLVTSYLCAKYDCLFSRILVAIVLLVMIIPTVGNQASEFSMVVRLGLYNHIWGMYFMKASFVGLYFLVFYECFKAIPKTYNEAAEIDGASDWTIMTRICFPFAKLTTVTILIIYFIQYWNDYQIPMLYAPDYPTISQFMFYIAMGQSIGSISYTPAIMASAMIVLIPVVVLFLCFHKKLLGNLSIGGIKG